MPTEPPHPLAGRRALVTGAGRGLGRTIARTLAGAGADVVVASRTAAELDTLAAEIRAGGRRAWVVPCDVTDPQAVAALAAAVRAEPGGLEILVNNAGQAVSHKFLDHPDALWHQMLAANLSSVYYLCKAFLPLLLPAGDQGRIINIASTAARLGGPYIAAYAAAKHGVLGLTRSLAAEFMGKGLTVNAICPSFLDTPMTDASVANIVARTGKSEAEARTALAAASPQRRLIAADEVAGVVLFLALDSSRGITGQGINIDGGTVMS